jgi:hypothetical protein
MKKRAAWTAFWALLAAPAWALQQERVPESEPARFPVRSAPPARPEGLFLNFVPAAFRGAAVFGGGLSTGRLRVDAPFALEVESDGVHPPAESRLEFTRMEFDAPVGGIAFDFDLVRVSGLFFQGRWDGEGVLTESDGVRPPQSRAVDLEGDVYGLRAAVEWPLVRYRSGGFEASLGPEFGLWWVHQELEPIPGAVRQFDEDPDHMVGSLGPRLRVKAVLGRVELFAEGSAAYWFDSLKGRAVEAAVGIGWRH